MKGRTVSILGLVGQAVCHKHSPALQQNPAPDEACRKESGHVPTELYLGTDISTLQAFHVARISFFCFFLLSPIL